MTLGAIYNRHAVRRHRAPNLLQTLHPRPEMGFGLKVFGKSLGCRI